MATDGRRGRRIAGLVGLLLALLAPARSLDGQQGGPVATRNHRFFASAGLGFVSLDRGVGMSVPLGFTAVSAPLRLLVTANLLDLGLLEGDDRDPRYQRPYVGSTLCIDSITGAYMPSYYCSGGTDLLVSASADLSYILLDEVWFGDNRGRLFVGLGNRFAKPKAVYGTIGVFFDARDRSAGGAKLAIGGDYVNLGAVWGFDLARIFRRHTGG